MNHNAPLRFAANFSILNIFDILNTIHLPHFRDELKIKAISGLEKEFGNSTI
jgi:hypothetical protein